MSKKPLRIKVDPGEIRDICPVLGCVENTDSFFGVCPAHEERVPDDLVRGWNRVIERLSMPIPAEERIELRKAMDRFFYAIVFVLTAADGGRPIAVKFNDDGIPAGFL